MKSHFSPDGHSEASGQANRQSQIGSGTKMYPRSHSLVLQSRVSVTGVSVVILGPHVVVFSSGKHFFLPTTIGKDIFEVKNKNIKLFASFVL